MLKPEFIEYLRSEPLLAPLVQDLLTEPEVSVRINPAKGTPLPEGTPVAWCPEGVYLEQRPKFTFDPALHQGCYYVQDASSMAVAAVVRQLTADSKPVRYLDACASPGGKATAALSVLPQGSMLVANEFDARRAEVLYENIAKWGSPGVIVTRGDTSRFAGCEDVFDIVAVDVPCSGEGMMRKDATARSQWSEGLVAECAALQREIIDNVWPALRPGGFFIYSTCTFNRSEDEDNLEYIIEHYDAIPVSISALDAAPGISTGIRTPIPCYRFLPGRVKGEGLFIAVVQKPGENHASASPRRGKKPSEYKTAQDLGWLEGDFKYFSRDNEIYAFPTPIAADMEALARKLRPISAGIHVATIKGKDLIPTQALALSTSLRRGAFPEVEVNKEQALDFLRREAITLPEGTPRGFVLLTFSDLPLGFVKNLGNRSNNLYPAPWRILSHAR